ncbi:MAG: hypothetical protein OXE50_02780 [Chloroflexi bacterium]|nr:hypothetical protein [Chloroflexota bacterium]
MLKVGMVRWTSRDVPVVSNDERLFALPRGNYDAAIAALRMAGLAERAIRLREVGKTSSAIVRVSEVYWSDKGTPIESDDPRVFVLADGDYDDAIAALKQAGFAELRMP